MTELARTPPQLRRLFRTIDFAPLPQHVAVGKALEVWREKRGSRLAPPAADIQGAAATAVLDLSILAEPVRGSEDFAISGAGSQARPIMGLQAASGRLSQAGERRLAVRLRRLFPLTIEYGEPVLVRFVEKGRSFEVLATPVESHSGARALFCTMAFDELPVGQPKR